MAKKKVTKKSDCADVEHDVQHEERSQVPAPGDINEQRNTAIGDRAEQGEGGLVVQPDPPSDDESEDESSEGDESGLLKSVSMDIDIAPHTFRVAQGLEKFVGTVLDTVKDGFDVAADGPAIAASAYTDILPAIKSFDQIGNEWNSDKRAFVNALFLGLNPLIFRFVK